MEVTAFEQVVNPEVETVGYEQHRSQTASLSKDDTGRTRCDLAYHSGVASDVDSVNLVSEADECVFLLVLYCEADRGHVGSPAPCARMDTLYKFKSREGSEIVVRFVNFPEHVARP